MLVRRFFTTVLTALLGACLGAACGTSARSASGTSEPFLLRRKLLATPKETCAINRSGKVACWDHTDSEGLTPRAVQVPLPATAVSLHDIGQQRCAVLETQRVYCWVTGSDPVLKTDKKGAVRLFEAGPDVCWIDSVGRLLCDTEDTTSIPVRTVAAENVVDGVGGPEGGCFLTNRGDVHCWYSRLQHGRGSKGVVRTDAWPIQLGGRARWLGGSTDEMCAWVEPSGVYCWTLGMENQPHPIQDPSELVTVALGCRVGCGVDREGSVRCWSPSATIPAPVPKNNGLGLGSSSPVNPIPTPMPSVSSGIKPRIKGPPTPETIPDAHGAIELSLGCHLCALFSDDSVYCMGTGSNASNGAQHVRPYRFKPFVDPKPTGYWPLPAPE